VGDSVQQDQVLYL